MAHTSVPGADAGHFGHLGDTPHLPHGGHAVHFPAGGHAVGHALPDAHAGVRHVRPDASAGGHDALQTGSDWTGGTGGLLAGVLPLLNVSSLLAFVTWFGAAGYLALHFGAWGLWLALPLAVLCGLAGAALIAAFIRKVLAGETTIDPADFRLEGTLGRVTVSVPERGAGEVVFTKAGRRRSEAARSATGRPIPRGADVVILRYERGAAHVQPWDELLQERPPPGLPDASRTNALASPHMTEPKGESSQ
jgi:hypothetical protein